MVTTHKEKKIQNVNDNRDARSIKGRKNRKPGFSVMMRGCIRGEGGVVEVSGWVEEHDSDD